MKNVKVSIMRHVSDTSYKKLNDFFVYRIAVLCVLRTASFEFQKGTTGREQIYKS